MWNRVVLLILFLLLIFDGIAQQPYRAVFSGGRVYLSDDNKFSRVKNGQLIDGASQIELVGDALVVLMDNAGRLTTLTLSGKYELEQLDIRQVGDSSDFVKSVWETYYNTDAEAAGGKSAPIQIRESSQAPFELWIPSSSQFYSNEVMLQWPAGQEPNYSVELINEFGEIFETTQVDKPELLLDLGSSKLVWKDEVTVRVRQPGTGVVTPLHSLDRLAPPDYEKLDRLIKDHFQDEDFAMILTKVAFFENQWLFADAITVLSKLRKERNALMKNFWNRYLIRNGFYSSRL
ncbi:MAG: hypothetical protein HEP71_09720 [Roseivirga sp.]|nr:hypothetical protein [Roseivirga sp.]